MKYGTPAAFRIALEQRLANAADATGSDLNRLRRRAVFERILARLNATTNQRWILKGGFALEVRLGDRARATRDLDFALQSSSHDAADVREALIDALSIDAGDNFTFTVGPPRDLDTDDAGRPGWRFAVTAQLAGRTFQAVRIDVVARVEEVGERTERITVSTLFGFADLHDLDVEIVDRRQHFSEKLHALTRDYGDRPNTRVKDLPDLLVLIEGGLVADQALLDAVNSVFAARATHPVPDEIPRPPEQWRDNYAEHAEALALLAGDLDAAHEHLQSFWLAARAADPTAPVLPS